MEIWVPILVALITSGLTLVGVIVNSRAQMRVQTAKIESELRTAQAVTDTKIEELTREVRAHNGHGERLSVLETKVTDLERRVS